MEIYDPLRKKQVKLTPEEEVRQGIIRWLNETVGAPLTLMASEYGFTYNRRRYRADIVVFDRSLSPLLMVECKAPEVAIDGKVIEQAIRYAAILLDIADGTGKDFDELLLEQHGNFDFTAEVPTYEEMLKQ